MPDIHFYFINNIILFGILFCIKNIRLEAVVTCCVYSFTVNDNIYSIYHRTKTSDKLNYFLKICLRYVYMGQVHQGQLRRRMVPTYRIEVYK